MVKGSELVNAGYQYIGTPYSTMDCQAFIERCLRDCGNSKDLPGSNAWYREVLHHGWVGTPEDCVKRYGTVPAGAFLFILKQDGGEPEKYKPDGIGNASHIGMCTGSRGQGAIHSSSSRGQVCESKFYNRTIPNGGWNRVGLWDEVNYTEALYPQEDDQPVTVWRSTIRKGDRGDDVVYMQQLLMKMGYYVGNTGIDGIFGSKTLEAVRLFQWQHGLDRDGIVGPLTWEALEKAAAEEGDTRKFTVTITGLTEDKANELKGQYEYATITRE